MAKTGMVTQFGMGSSIRSCDYTHAATRAIRDALWHNSLNVAYAFGFPKQAMLIDVEIGVQHPDAVDISTCSISSRMASPRSLWLRGARRH